MEIKELPDALRPFAPDNADHTTKVTLNFVAYTLVAALAKQDQRSINQWLSRFLVEAINKYFREEYERIKAEKSKEPTA